MILEEQEVINADALEQEATNNFDDEDLAEELEQQEELRQREIEADDTRIRRTRALFQMMTEENLNKWSFRLGLGFAVIEVLGTIVILILASSEDRLWFKLWVAIYCGRWLFKLPCLFCKAHAPGSERRRKLVKTTSYALDIFGLLMFVWMVTILTHDFDKNMSEAPILSHFVIAQMCLYAVNVCAIPFLLCILFPILLCISFPIALTFYRNDQGPGATDSELAGLHCCEYNSVVHTDTDCAICLTDFYQGDEIRILNCNHTFHQGCIDVWLSRKAVCPLCREAVLERDTYGEEGDFNV